MIRDIFACAFAGLLLAATSPAMAGIGAVVKESAACDLQPINPKAEPEWFDISKSLAQLIATGDYEMKSAYRFKACGAEFTIYLVQGVTDKRQVFECSSDDTYRPVVGCKQLGQGGVSGR